MKNHLPFVGYPHQGRMLVGRVSGSNCRHEYGLKFMKATNETRCAYCGLDIAGIYENWLDMALETVIAKLTRYLPRLWRNSMICGILSL